jgi:hypothetical protein
MHAMNRIALALFAVLMAGPVLADDCQTKAVGKDGRALAGAALTGFLKKCQREACEAKAVGSDGKPLHGAAKNSFVTKCKAGAG